MRTWSDDDLVGLDEFGLLHENAEQIGVSGPLPSVQRIESGPISAIKWGDDRRRWCSCTVAGRRPTWEP